MKRLIALAALLLLPVITQAEPPEKERISFIKFDDTASKIEVPVKVGGKPSATVILVKDELMWSASLRRHNEMPVPLEGFESRFLKEIGTVDLDGSGNFDVFVVLADGGTGYNSTSLNLINLRNAAIVGMTIGNSRDKANPVSDLSTTDNFNDPKFRKEKDFLSKIKGKYGYVSAGDIDKQSDKPANAYSMWVKENRNVKDGKLTIRKYKGAPTDLSSRNDVLIDGPISYLAMFKGGVIAYDQSSNEHYVLYYPSNMYNEPTTLKKYGSYLFIGTNGDGLVIVNLANLNLKRAGQADVIEKLEFVGTKLRINDSQLVELSNLIDMPQQGASSNKGTSVQKNEKEQSQPSGKSMAEQLLQLKTARDQGLITEEEYQSKRKQVLERF